MNLIKIRLHSFFSILMPCTESIFKDIAFEEANKFIMAKKRLHDKNRLNNSLTIMFIVHGIFLCAFLCIDRGNTAFVNCEYFITTTELDIIHYHVACCVVVRNHHHVNNYCITTFMWWCRRPVRHINPHGIIDINVILKHL